ncbi:hypothetical protein EMIHUDRAFT_442383 [Emiliania huxleyi CCMP1516]|uniref:Uncharacterized protein n=2 Tax=Emiliania huxleyi TaxID=2903 RepID=A0A0D3K506_EMIH1|nr:hypothetical protein EMIHUDRAFT_442595 [Emiliania huxleyi CCMP1516]XP_005783270.1 hypothetical protein EMIHUDRAFT_442383 [Emiliania huxleyi CCMP1516]EOD29895.1 hypothetical protein EMIHUDRAFT_442595 [Emiliania huxleyi CCMP1516]EOD30841.1 hypothetical protein EMIHUDRAFT_442383 [Emiliania huxleyi CCMP1516]|eukprot:XP_005782324.1 hypothetical protein EMIHUDRAFT_442595 [Emiliania huxleyi CCMP1516]
MESEPGLGAEPEPEVGAEGMLASAAEFAGAYPISLACALLFAAWQLAQLLQHSRSGSTLGGAAAKEDALLRARQVQQERMARAAEERAASAPSPACCDGGGCSDSSLPDRLTSALAKAPASGKAPASSEAPASGKAPAKLPADKQSVTARLAKIERGKGPSEHNPLQGHASSSSSAGICRRKKGG